MKEIKFWSGMAVRFIGFCLVLSTFPTAVTAIIYLLLGAPLNVLVAFGYWFVVNTVVNSAVIYTRVKKGERPRSIKDQEVDF